MRNLFKKLLVFFVLTIIVGSYFGLAFKSQAVEPPQPDNKDCSQEDKCPPQPSEVIVQIVGENENFIGYDIFWTMPSTTYHTNEWPSTDRAFKYTIQVDTHILIDYTEPNNQNLFSVGIKNFKFEYRPGSEIGYAKPDKLHTFSIIAWADKQSAVNRKPNPYLYKNSTPGIYNYTPENADKTAVEQQLRAAAIIISRDINDLFDPKNRDLYWDVNGDEGIEILTLLITVGTNKKFDAVYFKEDAGGKAIYDEMITQANHAQQLVTKLEAAPYNYKATTILSAPIQIYKETYHEFGPLKDKILQLVKIAQQTQPDVTDTTGTIGGTIGDAMEVVFKWIDQKAGEFFDWMLKKWFYPILGTNTLNKDLRQSDTNQDWIFGVWKLCISIVDVAVIIILILLSFINILNINIDTYAIKKTLPTLILGVILANFSMLICRMLVDFASVLNVTLGGGQGEEIGNGLANALHIGALSSGISSAGLATFLIPGIGTASSVLILIVGLLLAFLPGLAIFVLGILFYIRIAVIYLFAAISPLAFMALAFPPTQGLFRKWWSMFTTWTFMAVIVLLLFRIASAAGNSGTGFVGWLVAVSLCYLAIMVPFKMGGAIMSAWGGLIQRVSGLQKGGFLRSGIEREYAGRKAQAALAARRMPGIKKLAEMSMAHKGEMLGKVKVLELSEEESVKDAMRAEMYRTEHDKDERLEKPRQTNTSSKGGEMAQKAAIENLTPLLLTKDQFFDPKTSGNKRENHFAAIQALQQIADRRTTRPETHVEEAARILRGPTIPRDEETNKELDIWNFGKYARGEKVEAFTPEQVLPPDVGISDKELGGFISQHNNNPGAAADALRANGPMAIENLSVENLHANQSNIMRASKKNLDNSFRSLKRFLGKFGFDSEDKINSALGQVEGDSGNTGAMGAIDGVRLNPETENAIRSYKGSVNQHETLSSYFTPTTAGQSAKYWEGRVATTTPEQINAEINGDVTALANANLALYSGGRMPLGDAEKTVLAKYHIEPARVGAYKTIFDTDTVLHDVQSALRDNIPATEIGRVVEQRAKLRFQIQPEIETLGAEIGKMSKENIDFKTLGADDLRVNPIIRKMAGERASAEQLNQLWSQLRTHIQDIEAYRPDVKTKGFEAVLKEDEAKSYVAAGVEAPEKVIVTTQPKPFARTATRPAGPAAPQQPGTFRRAAGAVRDRFRRPPQQPPASGGGAPGVGTPGAPRATPGAGTTPPTGGTPPPGTPPPETPPPTGEGSGPGQAPTNY